MCVIYNSIHGNHPTNKQLRKMFDANPHGAGFAIKSENEWQVIKGVMSLRDLKAIAPRLRDAKEVIGHFRLATHGAINELNCHPFALHADFLKAQEAQDISQGLLFHNGILNGFGSDSFSDTLDFTVSVLKKLNEPDRIALLNSVNGKFIYLDSAGKAHAIGLSHHINGFLVSNSYWDTDHYWREDQFFQKKDPHFYADKGYAEYSEADEEKRLEKLENHYWNKKRGKEWI